MVRSSRQDCGTSSPPFEETVRLIKPKACSRCLGLRPVANVAVLGQNRADPGFEELGFLRGDLSRIRLRSEERQNTGQEKQRRQRPKGELTPLGFSLSWVGIRTGTHAETYELQPDFELGVVNCGTKGPSDPSASPGRQTPAVPHRRRVGRTHASVSPNAPVPSREE